MRISRKNREGVKNDLQEKGELSDRERKFKRSEKNFV